MEWVLFGEVRASHRASLAAGAEGEVRKVFVREGDRVVPGDSLLQVDSSVLRARVSAARAVQSRVAQERVQAQRELERYNRAGSEVVAGVEIERAASQAEILSAEMQSQRAAVQEASAELHRHVIRAPFAGVVSARRVDPGDWVTQGTEAFELVADDAREVFVGVPAELLAHIHKGDAAEVTDGRQRYQAVVVGVVDALDPATRTAPVRLSLQNHGGSTETQEREGKERPPEPRPVSALPPAGATVDVTFRAAMEVEGAWVVPRDALVRGPASTKVWRIVREEEGAVTAEPVPVEVLTQGVGDVLVRGEGLSEDAQVVTRGNERIRPGQPLTLEDL